jgi:hypothetical protein
MGLPIPARVLGLAAALGVSCALPATAEVSIHSKATEITITGRQHTQFNTTSVEGQLGSEFLIRRARLAAELKITDSVSGKVEPDFGEGGISLKDAYLKIKLAPTLEIVAGQFKRPFDLFELTSSTEILVVERAGKIRGAAGFSSLSSMTEGLRYSDRDVGLMARIKSSSGRLALDAAVTNGQGANKVPSKLESDDTARIGEKQYTGRLQIRPLEDRDVTLAAALTALPIAQPHADSTVAVVDLDVEYATAVEVSGEYGNFKEGAHLQAGAVFGDNWDADPAGRPSFLTFQGIATYKLSLASPVAEVTAVEPLVRVSWSDPDRDSDDDAGTLVTPGLQLFFEGRNKLAFNVDIFIPQSSALDTEYSLKVQSFLHF